MCFGNQDLCSFMVLDLTQTTMVIRIALTFLLKFAYTTYHHKTNKLPSFMWDASTIFFYDNNGSLPITSTFNQPMA